MRISDWSSDVCSSDLFVQDRGRDAFILGDDGTRDYAVGILFERHETGVGRPRDVGRLRIGSSVEQVALHLEWRLAPQGVEFGFVRAVKFADDLHALDVRDVGLNEPIPFCLSRFGSVFAKRLDQIDSGYGREQVRKNE